MDWEQVAKGLSRPFGDEDVFWRIDRSFGSWARVLCYLDARAVMDRLDEVAGVGNWQDSYVETASGKNVCTLSICVDGVWVSKSDGAGNTNIEGDKGGLSDAFKRAGVKWGIGRHLYSLGETKVNLSEQRPNVPKHYLVVASKRGEKTKYGAAPSVRELQKHLFGDVSTPAPKKQEPEPAPKETTEETKERRLERIRNAIRNGGVPKDQIGLYLEALTAIQSGGKFSQRGIENCDPKALPDHRLSVVSQRAQRWLDDGTSVSKMADYVTFCIDGGE